MSSFRLLLGLTCLAVSFCCLPTAQAQCQVARYGAPYLTYNAYFGSSVELAGNTAAVTGRNGNQRLVQVFERDSSGWTLSQELTADTFAGSYSTHMALAGDTIAVSNPEWYGGKGRVSIFQRTATGFQFTQTLGGQPGRTDSHFGRRLDLDGQQLAIAAPMDDTWQYRGGAVYVFDKTSLGWIQTARLEAPTPRSFGFFGLSIAIEGDLLVVGEPGYTVFNGDTNYVYVYRKGAGGWTLEQTLAPAQNIGFGYSVDLDGGRIVVGAFLDTWGGSNDRGSVYAYENIGGSWQLVETIRSNPLANLPGFGKNLSLKGDRLAVSANATELLGGAPQVQLLKSTATGWRHEAVIAPPALAGWSTGDQFGASIALQGRDLWIGAPAESLDGGPNRVGAAYAYTLADLAVNYCSQQVVPNSTGYAAYLRASGCGTLAANSLQLEAVGLPPHQFGMFLASQNQGITPLTGGSQGVLCLSGAMTRFLSQVALSGPAGLLTLSVDLENMPGGVTATAGETWHFQAWYRDHNPGPTSNTSDAISVFVQ